MRVIEGRNYLTWEDTIGRRREVRVDVYLGANLKTEIEKRAGIIGLSASAYMRDIIRDFVNTHPRDARPQEGSGD